MMNNQFSIKLTINLNQLNIRKKQKGQAISRKRKTAGIS